MNRTSSQLHYIKQHFKWLVLLTLLISGAILVQIKAKSVHTLLFQNDSRVDREITHIKEFLGLHKGGRL